LFDRGDSSHECLIEETAAMNVSTEKLITVTCGSHFQSDIIRDSSHECLNRETHNYDMWKAAVSSIKHSWLLSPLSNIQACCLLYQTFKAPVSSIKHSWLLSPLSNIQARGDSHHECLIEETAAMNV
jgi:hypothetical protein